MINPNAVLGGVALADAERVSKNTPTPPPQIVATRGCYPMASGSSGANAFTRWESAVAVRSGRSGAKNVQVIYTNNFADSNHLEAFEALTPFTLECAIVSGGRYNPVHFQSRRRPVLDNGGGLVISDETSTGLIAPDAEIWVKTAFVAPSTVSAIALGTRAGGLGISPKTKKQATALTTSRTYNTDIYDTATNYLPQSFAPSPLAIIGVPDERHVALIFWGDSITSGQGDSTSSALGHVGFLERAAESVNGFPIPFANLSRSSERTTAFSPTASPTRFSMFKYATHVWFAMGTNDAIAGLSLASMQANCRVAWAAARAAGCKVGHCTLPPRTTSTDGWTTVANQTANPTFVALRNAFNAWLFEMLAAGVIDRVTDSGRAVQSSSNPDVWTPNATDDGTHPKEAGVLLMAAVANSDFATLTV